MLRADPPSSARPVARGVVARSFAAGAQLRARRVDDPGVIPFTLAPSDARYPRGVADLDPPPILRVRGALPIGRGVALVGTRASSPEGDALAFEMAAAATKRGFVVWSGGALGIDAAAHRGALAAGGPTVVVLGGGLDRPTPPENAALFRDVLGAGGAIVSLTEDAVTAETHGFHARNAVVAAATELTVVVECGIPSGALSTARRARALGRKLAFVPHSPWSAPGKGCAVELSAGRGVAVATPEDVLALLGVPRPPKPTRARLAHKPTRRQRELFATVTPAPRVVAPPPAVLGALAVALFGALDEARHVDELCDRLGLSPREVVPALVTLALEGFVVEEPPGVFRRATG